MNSYYPPWIGGAETYVSNLAKGLVGRGDDVTVYCSSNPLPPGEYMEGGVRVRRMRAPLRLYGTPVAVSPFNLFRERYDVIHCNFPSPYLSALFAWFGASKGIPAVLTWHNDLPKVTRVAGVLVTMHDLLSPLYLGYYSRIIATTALYARESHILRRQADKVRVIPNGVDTEKFSPALDGGEVRRKYGLADDNVVVLFVGALTRWHAYKGVNVLLRAFKAASSKRDDLRLLIVGSGSLLDSYRDLARTLSLEDKLVFAGRVPDESLPYYYAACDFAVLPSVDRSEGFGLVLLEAMSSGKPVIGSRVGGVTELIGANGENGILAEPGDIESLSVALGRMTDDAGLRKQMGREARAYAESRSWRRTVELTAKVYVEAIGRV